MCFRDKKLDSWSLLTGIFWYCRSTAFLALSCEGLLLCLNAVSFREKSLIGLVPAGNRFFSSAKLCSSRARGRGERETKGKTQWVTIGKKNWEGQKKAIMCSIQVPYVTLGYRTCKLLCGPCH